MSVASSATPAPAAVAPRLLPPRELLDARFYPGAPADLHWIETHMSWLFFAGDIVFKLKKPLRTPYLDHTTVARREADCREELRLNQRLAPGVYLGLWVLVQTPAGLRLQSADAPAGGRIVDWLVAMRRLAPTLCLLERLRRRQLETAEIDRLGDWLARFYRALPPWPMLPAAWRKTFDAEQARNRQVLLASPFDPPRGAAQALDRTDAALRRHAGELGRRAAGLVEGHGDLRPEHVFLTDPPLVIDSLEFNPALRRVDPFDEVVLLGLECEVAGAGWIGPRLHDRLVAGGLSPPSAALLRVYRATRALLRARLMMAHRLDAQPREPERWPRAAERYVELALAALSTPPPCPWP